MVLLLSKNTDADLLDREEVAGSMLTATTLDIGSLDTANETTKTMMFAIQGLKPTGFAVNSVRLLNSGKLDLQYQITVIKTGGDDVLCSALTSKLLSNWQVVSATPLMNMTHAATLPATAKEDLIFSINLESTNGELMGKNCMFNLAISAHPVGEAGAIQFHDEELIANQVATGSWSQ